ncbi:MAG TPA: FAD-dependent oxidoreductase [Arenimonas sp.]|uniref:NAD(P)/FAD-dependent oxidoreductase n=1 Tax=Arenimonas sp. TaxID=1872635 RepID=UPI002D810285|nr:FAD-dependent oxidoreductase [Arenimonas sp.]HEU0152800.1 FAD-dependent oxidoreductase [Arenimonas sp.]
MRIAVIGSGVAGMGAAWRLSREHEVVLFERESRLGGHTHTHTVSQGERSYSVDSGFIVFNADNYPLFSRMLDDLGVPSQATTMSFSVQDARSGLEYNATDFDSLFCQRRNLVSPRFWGMVRDILRFYREAPALLALPGDGPSLGDYLAQNRYSAMFIEDHLVPMASALWSSPAEGIMGFPAKYLARFMDNHHMLQVQGRPPWRVVTGGSSSYIRALEKDWAVQVRLSSPVRRVHRDADGVDVHTDTGVERFDQVVLACHSDQALALLADPSAAETEVLGAIPYQANETVLHTDARLLPSRRKAWAAWSAYVPAEPGAACTVSYCMNLLQGIESRDPFVVTLNRSKDIDPAKVLARMRYHHPVYTHASVAAQSRRGEVSGVNRTWYAGAYWGFGFHEDGLRSGIEVARALGASWP